MSSLQSTVKAQVPLQFPCTPQCNCEARRILNLLQVMTVGSFLRTLAELRDELETKVLLQMEVLQDQLVGTLNTNERTVFLDILDQSLAEGHARREYMIRCKRLMKKLSSELGRLPSSFYKTGVTVTERKYKNSGCASIHIGMLDRNMIAIKEPKLPSSQDISAFYREAITWQYLDSEYILPFLGVAEVELYGPCLLSPWMEKGDITYYLENNSASDGQLIGFILQIVQGINFLHDSGIVHADIKPPNVLIDHENKALIADVGVAYLGDVRTITAKATRHSANGTLFYMAPELREHEENNIGRPAHHTRIRSTKESDVFALGILTGMIKYEHSQWKHAWENAKTRNGSTINRYGQKAISPCWLRKAKSRPAVPDLLEKLWNKSIFVDEERWMQKAISKLKRNSLQTTHSSVIGSLSITTPKHELALEDALALITQSDNMQSSGGITPVLARTSSRTDSTPTGSPFSPTAAAMAPPVRNVVMETPQAVSAYKPWIPPTSESSNIRDGAPTTSQQDSIGGGWRTWNHGKSSITPTSESSDIKRDGALATSQDSVRTWKTWKVATGHVERARR